jgi:hypothetical protein
VVNDFTGIDRIDRIKEIGKGGVLLKQALIIVLLTALLGMKVLAEKAPAFPNYRDLKIYTTSTPDTENPARIIARTEFVNDGKTAIKISARLNGAGALQFAGGNFSKRITAGKSE